MAIEGGGDANVGRELQDFFDSLNEEGFRPVVESHIEKLEAEGRLGEEAARALREADKEAIESHIRAAQGLGANIEISIVWPF